MNNPYNRNQVQKQIRAFNKQMQRAEKAGKISDRTYEQIQNLIDPTQGRMTPGGYAKAGSKYLESMSDFELDLFSSDISDAKNLMESAIAYEKFFSEGIDFEGKERDQIIWETFNFLEKQYGTALDSDQIKELADNEKKDVSTEAVVNQMMNVARSTAKHPYGMSDFADWFNSLPTLQE